MKLSQSQFVNIFNSSIPNFEKIQYLSNGCFLHLPGVEPIKIN